MSSANVKSSAKPTSEIFHTYLDELFRLFLKEYANTNFNYNTILNQQKKHLRKVMYWVNQVNKYSSLVEETWKQRKKKD